MAQKILQGSSIVIALLLSQSACSMQDEIKRKESSGYEFMAGQIIHAAMTVRIEDVFFLGSVEIGKLASAAERGNTEQMQRLVDQGVAIDGVGQRGMTPLLWAMGKRGVTGFRWLLEHGASPNLVSCCDVKNSQLSPMEEAAAIEDSQYLQALLEHGGNANLIVDSAERTPIFSAVKFRHKKNIELLVRYRADLNRVTLSDITVMAFGGTALQQALDSSQFEIALILLRAGADPCIKDRSGHTVVGGMIGRGNSGSTLQDREAFPQIVEHLKRYTCD